MLNLDPNIEKAIVKGHLLSKFLEWYNVDFCYAS
jgi:hypothetical protein